jgi:predicted metal-dependent hydrolase
VGEAGISWQNQLMANRRERHTKLRVAGFEVDVVRKGVKNLNLSVRLPDGRIRLSMPHRVTNGEAREFVMSRLAWIDRQRSTIADRVPPPTSRYVDGDVVSVWGIERTIRVDTTVGRRGANLDGVDLVLSVRDGDATERRVGLVDDLLRSELRGALPDLIAFWESVIGVDVAEWRLRKMTTRWGSCNISKRRIWLNVELATRDPESLESVVVHEMIHLVERRHNARFYGLMDRYLPDWRDRRVALNESPPPVRSVP